MLPTTPPKIRDGQRSSTGVSVMSRLGLRRFHGPTSGVARRPRLVLESLESRRLLSASATTISPFVRPLALDDGPLGAGSSGGSLVAAVTNPSPIASALTPAKLAAAYSINLAST